MAEVRIFFVMLIALVTMAIGGYAILHPAPATACISSLC